MTDYNALYVEKCRLQLDLEYREKELSAALANAQEAALEAEKTRAHLQRRIDALVRKVRAQHARLHPSVEYAQDGHGLWSWRCNGGPGCVGWVGHGEHSKVAARTAWDKHVKRDHKEAS